MIKILKGTTSAYFETGMEGVYWAVETIEASKELMHEHIYFIKEGDHALITSKSGEKLFDDVIVYDKESCRRNYPNGMGSQQVAGGLYVHWIQHGFSGDEWLEMFSDCNITVTSGNNTTSRVERLKKNAIPLL